MSVRVFMIESEAGWGSRVDEIKEFPTREEAVAFARDYNAKHNPATTVTPAWYIVAKVEEADA